MVNCDSFWYFVILHYCRYFFFILVALGVSGWFLMFFLCFFVCVVFLWFLSVVDDFLFFMVVISVFPCFLGLLVFVGGSLLVCLVLPGSL